MIDLRSYHVDLSYSDADLKIFVNLFLKRIIVDIKRRNNEVNTKERRSITRDILLKLLKKILITFENCMLKVFFCLVFVVFLSIDEFTYFVTKQKNSDFARWHLTRDFVTLKKNSMSLRLSFSKTNSWRQRVTIFIVAIDDIVCSIKTIKQLFARHSISSTISLSYIEIFFSRQHVITHLKSLLQKLRIESNYFDYFFRKDVAI